MNLGETCTTAASKLTGERNDKYGAPDENFGRIVALFGILTGVSLTVDQGIQFMQCVKLSRESFCHQSDNNVDLNGYTDALNWLRENRKG